MSSKDRNAKYYSKPENRERHNRQMRETRAAKRAVERQATAEQTSVSSVLAYQRGVLHGLVAAIAVVNAYNGGRSFTSNEISVGLEEMTKDIPATVVAIGDAMVDGELVAVHPDIYGLFRQARSRRRA